MKIWRLLLSACTIWLTTILKQQKTVKKPGKLVEMCSQGQKKLRKIFVEGEDARMFHVAQIYPIVSRKLLRWSKIVARRMKPSSSLANPWGIRFSRNMPEEVLDLLKLTVLKGHYGTVAKKTSCVETLQITTASSARE